MTKGLGGGWRGTKWPIRFSHFFLKMADYWQKRPIFLTCIYAQLIGLTFSKVRVVVTPQTVMLILSHYGLSQHAATHYSAARVRVSGARARAKTSLPALF